MVPLNERMVIYPGTFDPLTNGHAGLIRRGCELFDQVIVAVAVETSKKTLFSVEERVAIAAEVFADQPKVHVEPFSGLLVDYAEKRGVKVLLRGLRAVSDFEFEFQLALLNRKLNRGIQTIFLMTDYQWLFTSSTLIKTAARLGGDIQDLVPEASYRRLREKFDGLDTPAPTGLE